MSDPIGLPDEGVATDQIVPPLSRRRFLVWAAGASLGASAIFIGATVIQAMVPPARSVDGRKNVGKVVVARLSELRLNEPHVAEYGQDAVFVIKTSGTRALVLSAACPHVGCALAFDEKSGEFVCPCHGGAFTITGRRLRGPAPRGMISAVSEVVNGEVIVSGFQA